MSQTFSMKNYLERCLNAYKPNNSGEDPAGMPIMINDDGVGRYLVSIQNDFIMCGSRYDWVEMFPFTHIHRVRVYYPK